MGLVPDCDRLGHGQCPIQFSAQHETECYRQDIPISAVTLNSFFVDDCADGADTIEELMEKQSEMVALHEQGGFELAKWKSKCVEFMERLNLVANDEPIQLADSGVLGMLWKLCDDTISLKFNKDAIEMLTAPTKAQKLSAISKVYDPTGLFAPVVLIGKRIMQDFWRGEKVGWKDRAPAHLVEHWHNYQRELPLLTKIRIPRWLGCTKADKIECHLHRCFAAGFRRSGIHQSHTSRWRYKFACVDIQIDETTNCTALGIIWSTSGRKAHEVHQCDCA